MHINLAGMALVPWEISPMCVQLRALDVMTTPVIVLDPIMSVGDLHHLVFDHPHHAFPIVEGPRDSDHFNYGQLIGVMPASHIALMIKKKVSFSSLEISNFISIHFIRFAAGAYLNSHDLFIHIKAISCYISLQSNDFRW